MISAKYYEQNIAGSHIYDLVFGDDAKSLQSLGGFPAPWLPGPLEGTEGTQRILLPEVAEAIEAQTQRKRSRAIIVYCSCEFRLDLSYQRRPG